MNGKPSIAEKAAALQGEMMRPDVAQGQLRPQESRPPSPLPSPPVGERVLAGRVRQFRGLFPRHY
jgi:hypothetical protein